RDRWPITGPRRICIKSARKVAWTRQHDVVAGRVIVTRMRERSDDRPVLAPLRQHRQMFANLDTSCRRISGPKLAADVLRSIGFQVEAVELAEPARKENVDDGFRGGVNCSQAIGGAERGQVRVTQTKQARRASLNGKSARKLGMAQIEPTGRWH